jgi:hypothetical protein
MVLGAMLTPAPAVTDLSRGAQRWASLPEPKLGREVFKSTTCIGLER